jgi:hypothetical protein
MSDRDMMERLHNLQKELILKNKEFTDAMRDQKTAKELQDIYTDITSIYTEILAVRQNIKR